MSNRKSILAAHKAISATGASGAPPASSGYGSNAAAMANAYGGQGWAHAYGQTEPGLPRFPSVFTDGAFGPQTPILPVPINEPPPGSDFSEPRLFENMVGWNLPVGQPGSEGIKLADFATLKTLADLYSVARACIQLRKNEIRGIEWDILPTRDASKAMRGSPGLARSFGSRRSQAVKFFKRPDPDFFNWASFLDALCEEVFVYDALSILIRPKWAKGHGAGLLGSDLDSLSLLSGPTIRPLLGIHAERPRPPAPAYQQYLYGVPRVDLMSLVTERDLEDGMLSGAEMGQFRADQLLYLPMTPRRWTPYGFPPIERALIPVMAGLQKQGYQLDYYREGTVPAVYISPGGSNSNMTPNQIRELQDALNALAGDPAWKHKIIVLPADSKVMPQKQAQLADQFDEIVMNQVCMAFDVQPMELGIMPKVSTSVSPGAANQMSKASQNIHERKATKPFLSFVADIMNVILQEVCGQTDMRFMFEGLEEGEDEQIKTQILIDQVGHALRSIDEAREELDLQPWGLPETSDPGWATATGWTPLTEAIAAARTDTQEGDVFGPALQDGAPQDAGASADSATGDAPGSPTQPGSMEDASPTAGIQVPGGGESPATPGHAAAEAAAGNTPEVPLPMAKAEEVELTKGQNIRDKRVAKVADKINDQLGQLVESVRDGKIDRNKAVALATAFLTSGYKDIISKAIDDASDDLDLDYTGSQPVDNLAWQYGENQRHWLDGLILKAIDSPDKNLKNRINIYGQTLEAVYNKSYAQAAQSSGKPWQITWNLGPGENCDICKSRDGSQFTFDTLPGIPGSGMFGSDLCEGGPNCHCSLTFEEKSAHPNTAGQPFDAAGKTRAILSELEALTRHAKKGRAVHTWEPRHLSSDVMTEIIVAVVKGEDLDQVINGIKQRRTVDSDGQVIWVDLVGNGQPGQIPLGRSGSYELQPHDVNDMHFTPKGAKDPKDPNPVEAEHIVNMMMADFPAKALKWVSDARWIGPIEVPLDRVDFDDYKDWAAYKEPENIKRFIKDLKRGKKIKPAISVQQATGDQRIKIVDGHHRALAAKELDKPFLTYIGQIPENDDRWESTHNFQYAKTNHQTGSARLARPTEKGNKVSKASVHYREATEPGKNCGTCSMFVAPSGCTLVKGLIRAKDVCDEWDPATATATKGIHPAAIGDSVGEGGTISETGGPSPTQAAVDPTALQSEEEMMNDPALVQFFETGDGAAQIKWGTTGDISRCVTLATQTLGLENAQTFCQIRYSKMTGQEASGLIHEAPSTPGQTQ